MSVPHSYEHQPAEDVLEHEPEVIRNIDPIPVAVAGPVRVQDTGALDWSSHTFSVGATDTVQILQAHPMRSRVVFEVATQDLYIGRTEAEARSKSGGKINASAGKTLELRIRTDVWAIAASGTSVVSVFEEFWAN